jgi:hypothetical protein
MIDLASTAGDTNHLALNLSFELGGFNIEGRTFVKTWEQKFGILGYLEGYRTVLSLNSYEFVFLIYSDYKTNMFIVIGFFTWSLGVILSGMKRTWSWLSWLRMLRMLRLSGMWERTWSWLSML